MTQNNQQNITIKKCHQQKLSHDVVDGHDHKVLVGQIGPATPLNVPPLEVASESLQLEAAADEGLEVQLALDPPLVMAPARRAGEVRGNPVPHLLQGSLKFLCGDELGAIPVVCCKHLLPLLDVVHQLVELLQVYRPREVLVKQPNHFVASWQ